MQFREGVVHQREVRVARHSLFEALLGGRKLLR